MKLRKFLPTEFNRIARKDVGNIIKKDERFALEDGYYFNEDESVVFRSTNETGALFYKEKQNQDDHQVQE